MSNEYEDVNNVLKKLDDDSALYVLSLCLAANDLGFYLEVVGKDQRDEKQVFAFACSISIMREVAKMMDGIQNSAVGGHFSSETAKLFKDLQKDLVPLKSGAFTRETLKPVRDVTFHYDLTAVKGNLKIQSLLRDVRSEHKLKVRLNCSTDSCVGTRYVFADMVRNEYVNGYLNRDTVKQIAEVANNILTFTDHLLADLYDGIGV